MNGAGLEEMMNGQHSEPSSWKDYYLSLWLRICWREMRRCSCYCFYLDKLTYLKKVFPSNTPVI